VVEAGGSAFDIGMRLAADPADSARFDAQLDGAWTFGGVIHGGYLLAVAAHALSTLLARVARHPDPFSISAYYLAPVRPGPVWLRVEAIRIGRSVSTGSVSVFQADENGLAVERLRALASFGDLARLSDERRVVAPPARLPTPPQCVPLTSFVAGTELFSQVDVRLDPAAAGWLSGRPSGEAFSRGWFRLADARPADPLLLLLALDCLPATLFEAGVSGYAPTLELTAHIRARPSPGWLTISQSTRNSSGGYLEEDAEIWDSSGHLVAQSRQLARAPRS